ncbi:MAG: hypothetical protein IJK18_08315 [Clostridia bacterium]|nr:hypothetical protein [Clostridia bacterium]
MHPNDRCTTVAEFDDDVTEGLQRRARDEDGKSILVPQDMSYNEWKEKYVDKQYMDITEQILNKGKQKYKLIEKEYFTDENGTKYIVDNKSIKIKANENERKIANIMGEIFGGKIELIPVVLKPKGIQTPDYMINGEKFDLKEVYGNGKNTLDTAINKKKKQSSNFIFDISKTEMNKGKATKQIERIYESKHRDWINRIILIENDEILKIYKRK